MSDWYFSRSGAELYDKCPRARFHRTISGLQRVGSTFDQELGKIVHRAAEQVMLKQLSLFDAAAVARENVKCLVDGGCLPLKLQDEYAEQFRKEAVALGEGLVWAWGVQVLPELERSYNVVQVEEKMAIRKDGMVLPTIADVILEDKTNGLLVYPDWKTTKFVNPQWIEQWTTAAQLHTTALAVEQTIGREVDYCYVQALVKGRHQKGYQQSPLVWGYAKGDAGPDDKENFSFKYTSRKGWRRVPVWQTCSSEKWVKAMTKEQLMALVPRTMPIVISPTLADTWWRQHVVKERRIQLAKLQMADIEANPDEEYQTSTGRRLHQQIMDTVFPQHFNQCAPVIGSRCEYYELCHDPHGIGARPIESGLFEKRTR